MAADVDVGDFESRLEKRKDGDDGDDDFECDERILCQLRYHPGGRLEVSPKFAEPDPEYADMTAEQLAPEGPAAERRSCSSLYTSRAPAFRRCENEQERCPQAASSRTTNRAPRALEDRYSRRASL